MWPRAVFPSRLLRGVRVSQTDRELRERRGHGLRRRAGLPGCNAIVLVDAKEGFRMMAHGDRDLAIGDPVTARFVPFAGGVVPYFEKVR